MLSVYLVPGCDIVARIVLAFGQIMKSHCPSETQIQRGPIARKRWNRLDERMIELRTVVERSILGIGVESLRFNCFLAPQAYFLS